MSLRSAADIIYKVAIKVTERNARRKRKALRRTRKTDNRMCALDSTAAAFSNRNSAIVIIMNIIIIR